MAYFQSKPTAGRHFLQIPGPSNVPDRVLRAIDNPTMDHRGPDFGLFGKALLEKTRHVFKTQGPVVIYQQGKAWRGAMLRFNTGAVYNRRSFAKAPTIIRAGRYGVLLRVGASCYDYSWNQLRPIDCNSRRYK
mgnify:CR=1 FL=1